MYGLHVIQAPSGCYIYVGTVPTALCDEVPATRSDVMGQRAHKGADGKIYTYRVPSFETREAAVSFAESRGFKVEPRGAD